MHALLSFLHVYIYECDTIFIYKKAEETVKKL